MANGPAFPCGFRFCAAIARVVLACPDLTVAKAAEIAQCQKMGLYYRAERMGIAWETRRVEKRIPAAKIREAWAQRDLSLAEAAQLVGLSERTFWKRAKKLGLPPRRHGPRRLPIPPHFESMWRHGVGALEIAEHAGVAKSTILLMARRLNLAPRTRAHRGISIKEWTHLELADRMRKAAAAEQREMIEAEMADFHPNRVQVGAHLARAA